MKRTHSLLSAALVATALSSQVANASFQFVNNSGIAGAGNPYTAGGTEIFNITNFLPSMETVTFSSDINGVVSTDLFNYAGATPPAGAHKKIWFENSDVVPAGTTFMLCFDISSMIESSNPPSNRYANELRWYEGTPALSIDVEQTGGNNTFQSYAGSPTLPSSGNTHISNGNILRSRGGNTGTTLTGFTNPDTANYTSTAIALGDFGLIELTDPDPGSRDVSFDATHYFITPQMDLPAGSRFQISLGGVLAEVDAIPEPSRALLLGLAGLACLLRRRR